MSLFTDLIDDFVFNSLFPEEKPIPKTTAKKTENKIRTDEFRYQENMIYPGGSAKDISWGCKNMDLQYKCIRSRLMSIQDDLKRHGMSRDADKIDDILRQIDDHEDGMYNQLSDRKKDKYYELPGFYNDYDLSNY